MESIEIIPVFFFREDSGKEPVRAWLSRLSKSERAVVGKDIHRVQIDWPLSSSRIKSLGHPLWEIRSTLDNRIARIMFTFLDGNIVLLHAFIKKTRKTPKRDLKLAHDRLKTMEKMR